MSRLKPPAVEFNAGSGGQFEGGAPSLRPLFEVIPPERVIEFNAGFGGQFEGKMPSLRPSFEVIPSERGRPALERYPNENRTPALLARRSISAVPMAVAGVLKPPGVLLPSWARQTALSASILAVAP